MPLLLSCRAQPRHLLLRLSKNMLIAIKSAVFTCKQRSGSACSARGQITAFGLYCSLDDLSSSAFGLATPAVLPHSMRHLLLRLSKNMLIAIKSAVFTCKQRSGSACSARGQITAFGLYCSLNDSSSSAFGLCP